MNCTTCQHPANTHTPLAGCVVADAHTYCSCRRFVEVTRLPEPSSARAHDGVTYDPARDARPLNRQQQAVYALMNDGKWHTLAWIARTLAFPEASVSARLRDLRKAKWGSHKVERRCRLDSAGKPTRLWEYRLMTNTAN